MNIDIKNASFSYKNQIIFNDLNISIKQGEVLAILGQNGAGKTTLLRCFLGFLKLSSGEILLDNKNIKTLSNKDIFSQIAYVPQSKNSKISLSVYDMVLLGRVASFSITPKKADLLAVDEILDELKITHLKDKPCFSLSGGEFVMVSFARALVSPKQILVLDEIESNLDFKNQLFVMEFLEKLKSRGISLIFNTHFPEHAKWLCDKVVFKQKGGFLLGKNDDINEENLSKLYECKISIKSENDKYLIKAIKRY